MNINDIIQLLYELGIGTKIDADGKITFFNIYNNYSARGFMIPSSASYTTSVDNFKLLSNINEIREGVTIRISLINKFFTFRLCHPVVGKSIDKKSLVIEEATYSELDVNGVLDKKIIQFESNPRNNAMMIFSSYYGYDTCSKISFLDDGLISFNVDERNASFDNGFEDGDSIKPSEMVDTFNSNKLIPIFTNYYGKLYPQLIKTVNTFCDASASVVHHR